MHRFAKVERQDVRGSGEGRGVAGLDDVSIKVWFPEEREFVLPGEMRKKGE